MAPILKTGKIVVGITTNKNLKKGQVVIFNHSGLEKIKRISDIKDNKLYLLGDNNLSSTDSRSFGWIEVNSVIARVVWPPRHR